MIARGRKKNNPEKPLSLREDLRRHTRSRLEAATVQMLRRHGYRAMTIGQIVRAAGTTRTTFYKYFKSKSDLIHFLQDTFIEPEMVAISLKLDQIANPTWQTLRDWVTAYSGTWNRIHLFFEAYNEALITDPAVAATAIPNTYRVTSNMTRTLSLFAGEEREKIHGKLVIFLSMASQMLSLSRAQGEDARDSLLLDGFTDLFWQGFFKDLPGQSNLLGRRS